MWERAFLRPEQVQQFSLCQPLAGRPQVREGIPHQARMLAFVILLAAPEDHFIKGGDVRHGETSIQALIQLIIDTKQPQFIQESAEKERIAALRRGKRLVRLAISPAPW